MGVHLCHNSEEEYMLSSVQIKQFAIDLAHVLGNSNCNG